MFATHARFVTLLVLLLGCCALVGCKRSPAPPPSPAAPADDPSAPPSQRIPGALVRECPEADPADPAARDAAAAKLGRLDILLNNTEEQIVWAIHEQGKSLAPQQHKAILLHPLVCAKIYLSMFMFTGKATSRMEGPYQIVEIPARFRSGLPPGDYAHPIWHSADEWDAYLGAKSLILVFIKERLGAVYVPAAGAPAPAAARHIPWDDHWHWTDAAKVEQPRAAEFSYLFSADNPNVAPLQAVYTTMRQQIRAQKCLACHMPDNKHDTDVLVLLDYPNQALAACHSLVATLRYNGMPPGDLKHGIEAGIADKDVHESLTRLADDFEIKALEALYFESDKRGVPRPVLPPLRQPPPKDY